MRRFWMAMGVATLLAAVGAPSSTAGPLDKRILAAGIQYVPTETTVVEGQLLEFTNLDVAPHDVVALDEDGAGKPLFATDTIGTGATVPVEGVEKLRPGVYDFTCTLHSQMLGTVYIESAGG